MPPQYSKPYNKKYITSLPHFSQTRTSPCEGKCLAGNHIQKVHTLIAQGKIDEALAWLHSRNPFPGITGRVCPHPCEESCNRAVKDERMAIHGLERFAADSGKAPRQAGLPRNGKKIAVVGSGPAGLTGAHFLGLLGYEVDIYESAPVMGGAPRQVIPDFRLPKDIVDRETAAILAGPVRVFSNVKVGRDIKIADILNSYDAVLLACGLWSERILDIPGKEYLRPAVGWLKKNTLQRELLAGKKVVILGGGGVAFDCAFTARRLNAAHVSLVFPERENEIRAPREEVVQARMEDIKFYPSTLAQAIEKAGSSWSVLTKKITAFHFEKDGSLQVEYADESPVSLEADLVICASGLLFDEDILAELSIERAPGGIIRIDGSFHASVPGLYATGDAAFGPGLIGSAIRQGREAALAIHRDFSGNQVSTDIYLDDKGQAVVELADIQDPAHIVQSEEIMNLDYHKDGKRQSASLPTRSAKTPFQELEATFTVSEAQTEAERCLHCGHCMSCGSCVEACPGHILEMTDDGPVVMWPEQCWHCGCCRIACPTGSISYQFPLTMLV